MRGKLGRVGAWVVTGGILLFLFSRISLAQVVEKTRDAAWWTVPVALLFLVTIYLADSVAMWKMFGWFAARLSLREVLIVRGAAYLLAAVNYSLGQGAIVYFVHRVSGVPVLRGVATVLFIMGTNILVLLVLATGGLLLAATPPPALQTVVVIAYAGLAVYAVAVAIKPEWLRKRAVFEVLLAAGVRGHLKAMLIRVPHVLALTAFSYFMLRAFGVRVPLGQAVLELPVVFFIAVLPISVQGLGTTQAAMVFFFARNAGPGTPEEQAAAVLAASLVAQAIALAFQAGLGLACLRSRVGQELRQAAPAAPAAGGASEKS